MSDEERQSPEGSGDHGGEPSPRPSPLALLRGWLGGVLLGLASAGAIAFAIFGSGFFLRNLAQIIALLGIVALWRYWGRQGWQSLATRKKMLLGRELVLGDVIAEVVCPLIVAGLVLGIFSRVFIGDSPLVNDHTNHFYQGWVMAERLLPTGRISGWIPLRGAGYPAGVLYPVGANLLIAFVRYLTPSSLSWDMVYAVAFVIAMLICHLSAYTAARLIAGRGAGVVAGVISAIDIGAYRQSGWTFAVRWGVWPVCLSAALAVVAVVLLHRALARGSSRGMVAFAIVAGISLFTHPMAFVFLGLALPATILHAMIEVRDFHPLRVGLKGLLSSALALALAAFWLLPFLAFREEARTLGTGSTTLRHQLLGVVKLNFFDHLWVIPAALALIGGIGCWRQRWPAARLLTLLFVGIALLVNGDTLLGLDLDLIWSRLANVQPDRFYLFLRIFAYVLAGVGVAWIGRSLRSAAEQSRAHLTGTRRLLLTVVACVVFGSVIAPGVDVLVRNVIANRLGWKGRPEFWGDYMRMAAFIRNHARGHEATRRSVWPVPCPNRDIHCFQSSPIWTGIGHFHDHRYYTVCSFDRLFDMRGDDETLRLLGVRYRVTSRQRRGETPLFRAGALHLYEVPGTTDEPFTVRGGAQVELLRIEDELIELSVRGASEGDELTLHVPFFPNWQASLDGHELPIQLRDMASVRGLMNVPIESDGTLTFRYRRGAPEFSGALLTFVGLTLCLMLLWPRRWPIIGPARERLEGFFARERPALIRKVSWGLILAASLGGMAVVGGMIALQAAHRREFDTIQDFDRARVWMVERGRTKTCDRTWRGAFRCGNHGHQWVDPRYVWTTMGFTRGAIYAHPSNNAVLHIEYPDVVLRRSVHGGFGIVHGGGGRSPVKLQVAFDGDDLFERSYEAGRGWDQFSASTARLAGKRGALRFSVSCKRVNRRQFVFRAWTSREPAGEPQTTGDRPL